MLSATEKEHAVESNVYGHRGFAPVDHNSCWSQRDWFHEREGLLATEYFQSMSNGDVDNHASNLFVGSVPGGEPVSVIRYAGSTWRGSSPVDGAMQPTESSGDSLFQTNNVPVSAYEPASVVTCSEKVEEAFCDVGLSTNSWSTFPLAQCKDDNAPDAVDFRRVLSSGAMPMWNFSKVFDRSIPAVLNWQDHLANSCSIYEPSGNYTVSMAGNSGLPVLQPSAAGSFADGSQTVSPPLQESKCQQMSMHGDVNTSASSPVDSLTRPADDGISACILQSLQSSWKGNEASVEETMLSSNLPFEDQIRFRKRDYFGMPVNLSVLSKSDCTGQVIYSITTSCSRSMTKRKNKNPLATKFTVRNLKRLLQCQEAALRTSKYQARMDGSTVPNQSAFILENSNWGNRASAIPLFPTSPAMHVSNSRSYLTNFRHGIAATSSSSGGPLELVQQKDVKSSPRLQRPRFFEFESLRIGNFVVNRTNSGSACGNKVRFYFSKQQIIYDFEWLNERLPLKQFVAMVIRFGSIVGMHFQGSSIIIAVSEPPRCVLSSGKVSPIKRHYDGNCDITNGELIKSPIHKITLCKEQALVVQDLLLHHDSEMRNLLFHFDAGNSAVYDQSGEPCSFADHWLLCKPAEEDNSDSAGVAPMVPREDGDLDSMALTKFVGTALKPSVSSDSEDECHS